MLSSKLLIALCETDAEEWKFCIRNVNGSLSRKMRGFNGLNLVYGTPVEGGVYLMVDAFLDGVHPDLIYTNKGKKFESEMFGYRFEDAPAYFGV